MNAPGTSMRDRALPAITRLVAVSVAGYLLFAAVAAASTPRPAVDLGPCVHVFPNYGHNPFWEDPNAVAAVVNPFLRERP